MVRSGKERATANDDDATQLSGNEAQRIAGRNADHVAAGKASGAKRKANAMSEEEGKRRKAAHMREVRAEKAAEKADAAAAARETAQAEDAAAAEAAAATAAAEEAATQANMLELCEKWFFEQSIDWDEWDAFKAHARLERNLEYMERKIYITFCSFLIPPPPWRRLSTGYRYPTRVFLCSLFVLLFLHIGWDVGALS